MCTTIVIQFRLLENLLAELAPGGQVQLTVLQESQVTTSNTLIRKELQISVNVRAIGGNKILSWHCLIDEFSFYAGTDNGRFPEEERYNRAWERAETLKESLAEAIVDLVVQTDGIIELPVRALIPGTQNLVPLDAAGNVVLAQAFAAVA